MSRARRGQGGQALPLALATALVLLLGAVALFALGRVQLAAAKAQTAADLAALSAGRGLAADLGRMALDGPTEAAGWRERLRAVARDAAAPGGARVEDLRFPDAAWPPVAVEVLVSAPGPRGTRVRAVARAGLRRRPRAATGARAGRRAAATRGRCATGTASRCARSWRRPST